MENTKEKNQAIMNNLLTRFTGSFNNEQLIGIVTGAIFLKWNSLKNQRPEFKRIIDSASYDEFYLISSIKKEIQSLQSHPELKETLSELVFTDYLNKDKMAVDKIGEIFNFIENLGFTSADKVKEFFNQTVEVITTQLGGVETPQSVSKIVASLLVNDDIKNYVDFCAGTSRTALEISRHLGLSRNDNSVCYLGIEANRMNYLISNMLMVINEISPYDIINQDIWGFTPNVGRGDFDLVICDTLKIERLNLEVDYRDPRFRYGIPTRNNPEWLLIQNALYTLKEDGKGIIIGTKGMLVRTNDMMIRSKIIDDDFIEAVITLPDNLYERSATGTEVIIINKFKNIDRRNGVLFINASDFGYRYNKNQHAITQDGVHKILEAYKEGVQEEGFSQFVISEKIEEYEYKLNPIEYLEYDMLKDSLVNSVSLGDIAKIINGVQVAKKDLEVLSKEPTHYYLNIKEIEDGKISYDESSKLTFKREDWLGKYDIRPGDIVITSKGWAIKIAIVEKDEPAFISGNLTRIRVDTRSYNPYVLYEFLQSQIGMKMLEASQTGSTVKILTRSQLEKLQIPMFDVESMNQIGLDIKENKNEYEQSIEEATNIYHERRGRVLEQLEEKIRI